jgi:hypothetical protein
MPMARNNCRYIAIFRMPGEPAIARARQSRILKGGQQDRVVTVSLLLPPRSGRLSIAAFCVEEGRWSQRGSENAMQFASAAFGVPSRGAKLAIRSSGSAARSVSARGQPPGANSDLVAAADVSGRQRKVWNEVARIQRMLSDDLGASVASPRSETSLQLALENDKLTEAQKSYIDALQPAGEKKPDIIGYVVAVNGKLNSAELYPSNALFRKMWAKLLRANATEAIAANREYSETIPSIEAVERFLKDTEAGTATKQVVTNSIELETRDADGALYCETRRSVGTWINRSYLAK